MISFGSCIYPTLGSVKVSPSRVASPENYKHQALKVSGVTPRPELPLTSEFDWPTSFPVSMFAPN